MTLLNRIHDAWMVLVGKAWIEEIEPPRPLYRPTHHDVKTMVKDIDEYLKQHPGCKAIPADDIRCLLKGYMIDIDNKSYKYFSIKLSDLRKHSAEDIKLFEDIAISKI